MSKTATLFAVSIILSLILGEVVVRLFIPVRNIGPSFSEYDPVYGKRLKAGFSCERIAPEFHMQFHTNSLGFRGPEPSSFPDSGILFIGDSFTEGYGVSDGEEFPACVRCELVKHAESDSIPVVNAGIGQLGTGRWIKFLRNEGRLFSPRVVVLQLSDNDFFDNLEEGMFVLTEHDSLVERDPQPAGVLRYLQKAIDAIPGLAYSHLVCFAREALTNSTHVSGQPQSDEQVRRNDRLTYRLIEKLVSMCRREGRLVDVVCAGFNNPRFDTVKTILAKYDAPVVRIPTREERPDLYFAVDGHWNKRGHEYVAFQVLELLKKQGIFRD